MKIVVVGLGKVGYALTAQLVSEGHDIVVIDQKPDCIEEIVNIYDVRGVVGNGGCYDVQTQAFEKGADLLIAVTDSDEINMLACLVAKKIGTAHTIARIRTPEYERHLQFLREELRLSLVVNPEKAAAREIARVLRFPSAIRREQICRQRFELVEYRIDAGNPLIGIALSNLYRKIGVRVLICAVLRGQQTIIPNGTFTLQAGDKIYLTATPRNLELFARKLRIFRADANHIMIVGADRVSYYLVRELLETQKHVTLIDPDAAHCQRMSEQLPGAVVINGDSTDVELLREERIADMDGFVALTNRDETNIVLAMYASQFHAKVIAQIDHPAFADMAAERGVVDSVVSTASVTTGVITRYVRAMQNTIASDGIKSLRRLVGGRIEALEFTVGRELPFLGVPLRELKLRDGLLISGIVRRNGQTVIPSGDDVLLEGDDVVVVTADTRLHALRDIVK